MRRRGPTRGMGSNAASPQLQWRLVGVMGGIAISYIVAGVLVAGAIIHLDTRYLSSFTVFSLAPILLLGVLPYLESARIAAVTTRVP